MQPTVQVQGAKELRAAIKRAEDVGLVRELKAAHKEAAEVVAYEAQTIVPVVSGRLLESIRSSGTQTAGIVRAGKARVPYAGPIHFGWRARNIEPNPFLYEAADSRADEVRDTYFEAVGVVIDQIHTSA